MIKDHQQRFLDSLPDTDKVARIFPFDPETQNISKNLSTKIKDALPNSQVFYQGSTYLGIAGENDIDLTIINPDFDHALNSLTEICGAAKHIHSESGYAHWDFKIDGFDIDMGLQTEMTPLLAEQLHTQKTLEEDEKLKREYEHMKLESDGLPRKEYLIRKYEFWNRIID